MTPRRAHAQIPDPLLHITNGTVNAVLRDGNTLCIGGTFTQAGLNTGTWVVVDPATGVGGTVPWVKPSARSAYRLAHGTRPPTKI